MLPSILSLLASQVNAQVPQECSVVGQIYTSLGGQYPGGIPTDCCKYVTCQSGKVVSIDWSNQNLQGVVSPLFAELTNLRTLNLSNNRLAGDIPGILYTRLMYLDVSNNGLGQLSKDVANLVLTVIEELKKNNSNVFTREQACKIKESLYGVRVNTDVTNILSGKITKEDVFVFASLFQADLPIQDIETVLASVKLSGNDIASKIPDDWMLYVQQIYDLAQNLCSSPTTTIRIGTPTPTPTPGYVDRGIFTTATVTVTSNINTTPQTAPPATTSKSGSEELNSGLNSVFAMILSLLI